MAKKILFVCTGNTCRSSLAEAIALKIIADNPEKFSDFFVTSAGTYAMEGTPAARHAIEIAEEKGMSLQNFRSKPVTLQLIEEADLILTMTMGHKMELLYQVPEAIDKIFLLKEYIEDLEGKEGKLQEWDNLNVRDPFGQPLEVYRDCYEELYEAIEKAFEKIAKEHY